MNKISDKYDKVLAHFGLVPHAYNWLTSESSALRVCVYLLGAIRRKCYEKGDEYNLGHRITFLLGMRNNTDFETTEPQV